ncbi:MAG: hypothetical protein V7K98_06225 [Nostoc sp.]|uniref:hypothetical protein n=1 Tax=Nostoc sp. TaxID=1180 RepID=UPI002FF82553
MESKTVIDTQTLQQLEDEIKNELSNILKKSNFGEVLEKYGILGQNILEIQCSLDLTKIEVSDAADNQQANDFLQSIKEQNTTVKTFSIGGFCKPCPVPGYPNGCWVA